MTTGDTMKALRIVAPGRVEWTDAAVPAPGPDEVLLRVEQVNTCPHWDLHLMDGLPMFAGGTIEYPYTVGQPGHEAVGQIAAVGPNVEGLSVGRRVVCWRDAGHDRQGCYAQYVCMGAGHVLPLPDDVTWDQATSLELAMCVHVSFEQLLRNRAVAGTRFGVAGLGPAGLVAVQMAKAYGAAEVIGIDPLDTRRDMALTLGADRAVAPDGDWLADRHGARALDAAIDCTGLKASIEFLMDRARRAVAIFGVLREELAYGPRHWAGLSLIGYEPHHREAADAALDLVGRGKLDLAALITEKLPFSRYQEGIEKLRRKEAIKICYLPWRA